VDGDTDPDDRGVTREDLRRAARQRSDVEVDDPRCAGVRLDSDPNLEHARCADVFTEHNRVGSGRRSAPFTRSADAEGNRCGGQWGPGQEERSHDSER